jgi:hypothetical protein
MSSKTNPPINTPEGFARIKREIESHRMRRWAKERAEILLDLANLTEDCARFRRRFPVLDVSMTADDSTILNCRDELKRVWDGEAPHGEAIAFWINRTRMEHKQTWVVSAWAGGRCTVHPNYHVFCLSLSIAVGELSHKMAICANPDCPQKYFLKARQTQRFCDRRTCAAFGQRQHKLNWWHTHKGKLRGGRKSSMKRPKDRGKAHEEG